MFSNSRVTFEPFTDQSEKDCGFAVVVSRYQKKLIFVKHKKRSTVEIPGGRRESGESIVKTAERELREETGAIDFTIVPVEVYRVFDGEKQLGCGLLCYADIVTLGPLPDMEIEKIFLCDDIPTNLTYPTIQPRLFEKVMEKNLPKEFHY